MASERINGDGESRRGVADSRGGKEECPSLDPYRIMRSGVIGAVLRVCKIMVCK